MYKSLPSGFFNIYNGLAGDAVAVLAVTECKIHFRHMQISRDLMHEFAESFKGDRLSNKIKSDNFKDIIDIFGVACQEDYQGIGRFHA